MTRTLKKRRALLIRHMIWGVPILFVALAVGLLVLTLTGGIRRMQTSAYVSTSTSVGSELFVTSSHRIVRRIDGVFVDQGEEQLNIRAVMIDQHVDARPAAGLAQARVVIEAPVEGGIPRVMAMYDATTTVEVIGPVRSARPYFVDWARGWNATYVHVGGSPESLEQLRNAQMGIMDMDEMRYGGHFWRSRKRAAPHSTFTSTNLIQRLEITQNVATQTVPLAWHFQDAATTTERGGVSPVRISFGGLYSVQWRFDYDRGVYRRFQGGSIVADADQEPIEAENIMVIKTDARVLDDVGRLRLRTVGNGDAIAYRDGNKYPLRWRRSAGEPIRFEQVDGTEFLLNRGRTWIEVTTTDQLFAGL